MPNIFKALASISAWVLFVLGWTQLVIGSFIGGAIGGAFATYPPPMRLFVGSGIGIACFILAIVAMKFRQTLGGMPPIFKALATISAWVLFVFGWVHVLMVNIGYLPSYGVEPPPIEFAVGIVLGIACFILGIGAMKLRKMLE